MSHTHTRTVSINCQKVIDQAHMLIVDGFTSDIYVDDNEGPCMLAYDKGLFGRCCQ